MSKSDLLKMLESTSLSDLKSMIITKEKLDKLLEKKSALERNLSSIDKEIESITGSTRKQSAKSTVKQIPAKRIKRIRQGKKSSQPSIESLTVQILQEKKRTLSVNEIADCLLNEKKYKTTSGNFKNQVRVLLYRNKKGIFKKVASGQFALAGGNAPAIEMAAGVKKKSVIKKKATTKKKVGQQAVTKKVVQKKKSPPTKKTVVKKTVAKPTSAKKVSPTRKIAQPSIQSLIVDVLKEKKKAMTIQELSDALLKEKKYQTAAKDFKGNMALILYENKKGLFRRVEAGKFGLA